MKNSSSLKTWKNGFMRKNKTFHQKSKLGPSLWPSVQPNQPAFLGLETKRPPLKSSTVLSHAHSQFLACIGCCVMSLRWSPQLQGVQKNVTFRMLLHQWTSYQILIFLIEHMRIFKKILFDLSLSSSILKLTWDSQYNILSIICISELPRRGMTGTLVSPDVPPKDEEVVKLNYSFKEACKTNIWLLVKQKQHNTISP